MYILRHTLSLDFLVRVGFIVWVWAFVRRSCISGLELYLLPPWPRPKQPKPWKTGTPRKTMESTPPCTHNRGNTPSPTHTLRALGDNEALPSSVASVIMVVRVFHLFLFLPVIVETALPAFIAFCMAVVLCALFRGLQCSLEVCSGGVTSAFSFFFFSPGGGGVESGGDRWKFRLLPQLPE